MNNRNKVITTLNRQPQLRMTLWLKFMNNVHSIVDLTSMVAYTLTGEPNEPASILHTSSVEESSVGAKFQLEISCTWCSLSIVVGEQMLKGMDTTRDSDSGSGSACPPYFLRSQFFGAVRRNFRLLITPACQIQK